MQVNTLNQHVSDTDHRKKKSQLIGINWCLCVSSSLALEHSDDNRITEMQH